MKDRDQDDHEDQKRIQQLQKQERDRELNDLRYVVKNPGGRRFLWRLLSACGVYRSSIAGTPEATYTNEGKRLIGLAILNDLNAALPTALLQMQQEHESDLEARQTNNAQEE